MSCVSYWKHSDELFVCTLSSVFEIKIVVVDSPYWQTSRDAYLHQDQNYKDLNSRVLGSKLMEIFYWIPSSLAIVAVAAAVMMQVCFSTDSISPAPHTCCCVNVIFGHPPVPTSWSSRTLPWLQRGSLRGGTFASRATLPRAYSIF